jgi:hypothetical protein
MLPLTVYTKNTPRYVHSKELRSAVKAKYPDRLKDILKKYSDMITGQSARAINREPLEIGVYPMMLQEFFISLKLKLSSLIKTMEILMLIKVFRSYLNYLAT